MKEIIGALFIAVICAFALYNLIFDPDYKEIFKRKK